MDEDSPARVYRRVRRRPQRAALLSFILVGNAALQIIRTRHDVPLWWAPVALALLVAVGVWGVLTEWRARTVVTDAGVTRQGPLRTRTWAWPAVYDLRVEPSGSHALSTQPGWPAYLYDTEGRRFLLPHINEWQLDDPYAEVATLRSQARWYGMPGEQRPEIEARILRRAGQRKGWQWASVAAVIVFVLMLGLALAEDVSGTPANLPLLLLAVPLAAFGVLGVLLSRYCATRALRLPR
ncbi:MULTISPECIES: PH domain-containing protein [unclassified Streptomyces]|uniref:PH domain-containing protein n=1 Tax=unclassified Streptomyces TaxID=2593676 RepID=UPI00404107C7